MANKMYSSKEVREELGITRDTLRWYEKKGLIKPTSINYSKSGSHMFDEYTLGKIYAIKILSDSGMSTDAIREKFLDNETNGKTDILIDKAIQEVKEQIKKANKALDYLLMLKYLPNDESNDSEKIQKICEEAFIDTNFSEMMDQSIRINKVNREIFNDEEEYQQCMKEIFYFIQSDSSSQEAQEFINRHLDQISESDNDISQEERNFNKYLYVHTLIYVYEKYPDVYTALFENMYDMNLDSKSITTYSAPYIEGLKSYLNIHKKESEVYQESINEYIDELATMTEEEIKEIFDD